MPVVPTSNVIHRYGSYGDTVYHVQWLVREQEPMSVKVHSQYKTVDDATHTAKLLNAAEKKAESESALRELETKSGSL